ncbi:glycoside hydrolase family 47 protein [Coniophora puteana RWD-64-598 SS2]|uniref:alpha-1,2-Mannosidase n=1 Tax=Coniophora puteana (strain RWD-64-598) TaxID=741705 RepID=A0A5M3MJD1_CONPW|nr:glycoside hydrolase family 47 protein [Coniophora puteana RWD-64-598 SS2]EIW79097.1 glycoside hydrolase family 47 protein [Coniophora puteana RWD-64-598 SS2]
MSSLLNSNFLRTNPVVLALRRKGVSIRHVAVATGLALSLCVLYYNYLPRREVVLFPEEVIYYPPETQETWSARAEQVKAAFLHAYHGYEKYAMPADELRPLSKTKAADKFNGWGVTAVDSLDTMLLMGLNEEFERALPIVQNSNYSLPTNTRVPFFETVIRYMGGMLSAYAMSKEEILRTRAGDLGTILTPAFDSASGFPTFGVDTVKGNSDGMKIGILAEIASYQMEYAYLGKITGKKSHVDHARKATELLQAANLTVSAGAYPVRWDLTTGQPTDYHVAPGGAADSAHEYTLKQFLLTGKTDKANLEMYLRATMYIMGELMFISPKRHLLYATDVYQYENEARYSHTFEHLSCFLPGLFALGVHTLPLDDLASLGVDIHELAKDLLPRHQKMYDYITKHYTLGELHLWAAQGMAQTCWLTYADQPTGLGPDSVTMRAGGIYDEVPWLDALDAWRKAGRKGSPPGVGGKTPWTQWNLTYASAKDRDRIFAERDYGLKNAAYYLRPEAVESFYLLWRTTGDVRWRHHGWDMFQAIEKITKVEAGYACVHNVHLEDYKLHDEMPSFFLAETLKYLYLLFHEEDLVPLEQWVFNTEAHPLPVFEWEQREKEAYGIN